MKKIWKNHKIKVIILGYIIIVGALLYFAVFSVTKKIADKSDEIQSKILDWEIENSRVSAMPDTGRFPGCWRRFHKE